MRVIPATRDVTQDSEQRKFALLFHFALVDTLVNGTGEAHLGINNAAAQSPCARRAQ